MLWNFNNELKRTCVRNLLQLSTSSILKFLLHDYQKNWQTLLINGKSNIHPLIWSLLFHSTHWLNILMQKIRPLKNIRTPGFSFENKSVLSKLESQHLSSQKCDSNFEFVFTHTIDPLKISKPQSELIARLAQSEPLCFKLFSMATRRRINI